MPGAEIFHQGRHQPVLDEGVFPGREEVVTQYGTNDLRHRRSSVELRIDIQHPCGAGPVRRRPSRKGRSLFYAWRVLMYFINTYSVFYANNKILSDDMDERNSYLYLINIVGNILKEGSKLLGIEMPNKM